MDIEGADVCDGGVEPEHLSVACSTLPMVFWVWITSPKEKARPNIRVLHFHLPSTSYLQLGPEFKTKCLTFPSEVSNNNRIRLMSCSTCVLG